MNRGNESTRVCERAFCTEPQLWTSTGPLRPAQMVGGGRDRYRMVSADACPGQEAREVVSLIRDRLSRDRLTRRATDLETRGTRRSAADASITGTRIATRACGALEPNKRRGETTHDPTVEDRGDLVCCLLCRREDTTQLATCRTVRRESFFQPNPAREAGSPTARHSGRQIARIEAIRDTTGTSPWAYVTPFP